MQFVAHAQDVLEIAQIHVIHIALRHALVSVVMYVITHVRAIAAVNAPINVNTDAILNVLVAVQIVAVNVVMDAIHVWVNALQHAMKNVLFYVRVHAQDVRHHVNMHVVQHA